MISLVHLSDRIHGLLSPCGFSISNGGFLRTFLLAVLVFPIVGSAQLVEQWTHHYDGPLHSYAAPAAIASDAAGNVIVAGTTAGIGSGQDLYVAKYAALDGALLWERTRSSPGVRNDRLVGMSVDAAGNIAITGFFYMSDTNSDIYTACYASDGTLLWEQQHDGAAHSYDAASAIAFDASGDVIVTGYELNIGTGDDWYTVKYAATDGARIWERRLTDFSTADTPHSIAIDSAGNVIVTGAVHEPSGAAPKPSDIYTVKYAAADGAPLWAARYGTSAVADAAYAITVDSADNVLVTGTTSSDVYTAKYAAATGELVWDRIYNGPGNGSDAGYAIIADLSGNVIITGESTGIGTGFDLYTAKYSAATGAVVWEKRFHETYAYHDWGRAVKLDSAGNVIVAGTSYGNGLDFYVANYAAADGAVLWEFRYAPITSGSEWMDGPNQLALTPDGGAVITGYNSEINGTSVDTLTVKIAPYADADADGLPDPWELGHWGSLAAHSAHDDSDDDGIRELAEYAFGLDPRVPERASRFLRPFLQDGYLTIIVNRRAGVTLTGESAGSLQPAAWSSASTTVLIDTSTTLKVRDDVPTSAGGSRFLRVKISAP